MKRTAEAAARTRDEVLDAALFCFAERGWEGSTLEGIGQRAGLTRGAVYHHFGDKSSLLQAVLRESWASQSRPILAPLLDDGVPPPQRLADFVGNYLAQLGSDSSLRALAIVTTLVASHVRDPVGGMDDHRLALDVWREHLARVIDSCVLRPDVTTPQVLFGVLALLTGATLEASTDPAHLPDPGAARVVATAAVRGWLDER